MIVKVKHLVRTFLQIVMGKYGDWCWGSDWGNDCETGTRRGSLRLGGASVWGGCATAAGVNDPG